MFDIKQKSYSQLSEKLFIGLTTKPCYALQGRNKNNTTFFDALLGQKSDSFLNRFSQFRGLDGTRTRDPMRDRHVF